MQVSIKDVLCLLRPTDEIHLGWDGCLVEFNPLSVLDVDAYGDYLVSGIRANGENAIEIDLVAKPVKVCRLKVAHSIHSIRK